MKAIITVGLPGCGKSSFARGLEAQGWRVIERDRIRADLMGRDFRWEDWDTALEDKVTERWWFELASAVEERVDLVVSDTNITPRYRRKLLQFLTYRGVEVEVMLFDIPMKICKQRNRQRERPVEQRAYDRFAPMWKERHARLRAESQEYGVLLTIVRH